MKKLLLTLLVFSFALFISCSAEATTALGGNSSETEESSSSEAESSVEVTNGGDDSSVAKDESSSTADESSSEAGDSSSEADNSSSEAVAESSEAEVSHDPLCGEFEGKVGSTERDEWAGDLILDWNIVPVFFPSGIWDEVWASDAALVMSEGCLNEDGDCEVEISLLDGDCAPFATGTAFLNKNDWDAEFEFASGVEPAKLVGEIKGVGDVVIQSFGEEKEFALTSSYKEFELDLTDALGFDATEGPAAIILKDDSEYAIIKNIRFE